MDGNKHNDKEDIDMSFIKALESTSNEVKYTENGMAGYKSIGDPYIDFLYKISSLRPQDESEASFKELLSNKDVETFLSSLDEKQYPYLPKFLTYLRDPRKGLGERSLYRAMLYKLFIDCSWENQEQCFDVLLDTMGKYGRYDDMFRAFYFFNEKADDENCAKRKHYFAKICGKIKAQLFADVAAMEAGKPISLLAKWMPSINTKGQRKLANVLRAQLGLDQRQYRKIVSSLRKYLKVTEVSMSAREWGEVDYQAVPSKANVKYAAAFMRHDHERREKYLETVEKGEAKINSSVNTPVDVVAAYYNKGLEYDKTLELLWKSLSSQEASIESTLVVRDDSGSMTSRCNRNTQVTAYQVATALAIYCAQRNKGEYKDKLITFSMTPRYLDFGGRDSLLSIIQYLREHSEVANTNIRAVFQLVLKTAIEHNVPKEEMPKQILIISDMEFDQGAYFAGNPLEESAKEFEAHGYELPKLIFWNVCGRTNVVPMKQNKNGVFLLSG